MLSLIIFVVGAYILFQIFVIAALVFYAPKIKKNESPKKKISKTEKWFYVIMAIFFIVAVVSGLV